MAEQADAPERDDEELDNQILDDAGDGAHDQDPQDAGPADDADDQDDGQGEGGDADDEDEFEISFGDEAAPASRGTDSDLVRHLRAEVRKRDEKLSAYERGEIRPVQAQAIEVGEKPTLESCDYDEGKFEAELDAFKERKRKADEAHAQVAQRTQAAQERFNSRLQAFSKGKSELKVKDFEIAEAAVLAGFNQVQQAVVIQAADDSAKLVYALGRHPEKLKALAAIDDPIEFTKALVKLEGQLKVTSRSRTPPEPDRQPRGSAPLANRTDKTLERLEKEAERTGDRTKVVAHKRRLKAQGKS